MKISTLIIDEFSLASLEAAILDRGWFKEFSWPSLGGRVRRIENSGCVYLISNKATELSRYIVINVSDVFEVALSPQHVFDQIVRVALSVFERTSSIPFTWRSYNEGSRYSIYAQPEAIGKNQRIYFDKAPRESGNLYVYSLTEGTVDFASVPENMNLYDRAMAKIEDALLEEASPEAGSGAYGIILNASLGAEYVGSATLEHWVSKKLTREQRIFVDRGYDEPVRLKGPAGSGKTLSMAIKCLKDIYAAEDAKRSVRFAFLTHSSAVAEETIPGMFSSLDPTLRWRELQYASLWVGSLYELAQEFLRYDQKNLQPLSTDGKEGREFQFLLIHDAIKKLSLDTMFMRGGLPKCSDKFKEYLEKDRRHQFVRELMNEFACVIDAEGIRSGTHLSEKYIHAIRENWQLELPSLEDRLAVLRIHDAYVKDLEESNVLSLDQMIADFNRYLGLHEWSQLRERIGFDAIFVDELHYFNRAERMIFHNLFRRAATADGKMPIFMSYDLKQSPSDAMLGYREGETASNFFRRIGAGESQLVEFTKVFRSTPQITEFLADLDASFPALDLEDEWTSYRGVSNNADGDRPALMEYESNTALLDEVFEKAKDDTHEYGGKNVAVLCMNEDLFSKYLKAGRISGKYIPLTARDQIAELKYAGRRCVFSMPEYVAGLQFASVYLIHVDAAELADATAGQKRRMISKCYLGASRASLKLELSISKERGGRSEILQFAVQRGSLVPHI